MFRNTYDMSQCRSELSIEVYSHTTRARKASFSTISMMSLTLFHTALTPQKLAFDEGYMMDNDG